METVLIALIILELIFPFFEATYSESTDHFPKVLTAEVSGDQKEGVPTN